MAIRPASSGHDALASMVTVMLISPGPALSSATRGMSTAARRMDTAAHNVANVSTDAFAPLRADGTQGPAGSMDFVDEFVDATMLAPFAYTANAAVARTAAEMQRALLDIRA
jgi:flagellar hook protein FlgE